MTVGSGASIRTHARLAGAGYLVIIVTGIFAEFFVRGRLIVPGNAAATAASIDASALLYRSAVASELVMVAADVLVAFALYVVFRGTDRNLALLATLFRMTHAAIVGANLLNAWMPVLLGSGAPGAAALGPGPRAALTGLFLDAHAYGYAAGLVFFGIHCLLLGALIIRSRLVPRPLGFLLLLAGTGYLVDAFARTLLVSYSDYETVFGAAVFGPAFVGELSFCLWLLVRGVDAARLPARQRPA